MTVWHAPQPPGEDEHGYETHPAYGSITAHRVSNGGVGGGSILFDSDIRHGHTVVVTLSTAIRKRDLHHDWVHDSKIITEIEMSEAQWASFVSSMNTSGVPCTIRRVPGDFNVPGLEYAPRLQQSMDEVHDAADRLFEKAQAAYAAYTDALANGGAKEKREALRTLGLALDSAKSNMGFAAESLSKHAENVVQRARADVEAMVYTKARQLGLDPAEMGTLELMSGEPE